MTPLPSIRDLSPRARIRLTDIVLASTQRRHIYYCRTRQSRPPQIRRRSCATCVKAKSKCSWPGDPGVGVCVRCTSRGLDCGQIPAPGTQSEPSPSPAEPGSASRECSEPAASTMTTSWDGTAEASMAPQGPLIDGVTGMPWANTTPQWDSYPAMMTAFSSAEPMNMMAPAPHGMWEGGFNPYGPVMGTDHFSGGDWGLGNMIPGLEPESWDRLRDESQKQREDHGDDQQGPR